jgi:O-antigen ligase
MEETLRIDLFTEAIELWKKNPILGNGAAQMGVFNENGSYAHDNYAEILADFGLVGFILYYSLHLSLLVKALRRGIRNISPIHARAVVFLFAILLLDIGLVSYSQKISWILLGMTASLLTAEGSSSTRKPAGVLRLRSAPLPKCA